MTGLCATALEPCISKADSTAQEQWPTNGLPFVI